MLPYPMPGSTDPARSCFTCRWWLATRGRSVDCGHRPPEGGRWVIAQPERGCCYWTREPGADDALP